MRYLIDYESSKHWLRTKSEKRIKVLRSNNGGEYTFDGFIDFCSEARIKMEFIVSYKL